MKQKQAAQETKKTTLRDCNEPIWKFTSENDGSFIALKADYVSRLYFPLMNSRGMKCSVTPELKGDICIGFDKYLTIPVVTEDLHRVNNSRNFWLHIDGEDIWSVTGNSAGQKSRKWLPDGEHSEIHGRIGSFKVLRRHSKYNLAAETTVFVPAVDDQVEIMSVAIKNEGQATIRFTPFSAIPLFARHADNLRDHRQVTTMFQRLYVLPDGVLIHPTIVHDEHGHRVNKTKYISLAMSADGAAPECVWGDFYEFVGQGGSLDNPRAVFQNLESGSRAGDLIAGKEAICAARFKEVDLQPGQSVEYILINGITDDEDDITGWRARYGTTRAVLHALDQTHEYWQKVVNFVKIDSQDSNFDNWMRWITFQLKCRQIFGNSYLPDFGYGRGGRGWRDLWQDLLSIFLVDPDSAKAEMVNNFLGIRIDGSNATIIGTKPGEFIADRNNVPRTWSDHGVWPAFVLNFYIQQSGDYQILFNELTYWKDVFSHRCKRQDPDYSMSEGNKQLAANNTEYVGTIFEHVLVQQLSAFFHVGEHNILLLEGADWNDTLDMARERGESVCFYSFYGYNMLLLAEMLADLQKDGYKTVSLLQELTLLLDTLPDGQRVDYNDWQAKRQRLENYFSTVRHNVSGRKVEIAIEQLIRDLRTKAESIYKTVSEQEWLKLRDGEQFFNGHYDNDGQKVHGEFSDGVRMDLTSQVIPLICGVANEAQINALYSAANRYLSDGQTKGLRLCTDYKELKLNLGRLTGFVYGHKEHGSKWMQQNIMFAYGLYKNKKTGQGYKVISDVYALCMDSATAQTFPGIPSYFELGDHGRYMYLTASPAWLLLVIVTQMFGVRGEKGKLCLNPRLVDSQFKNGDEISLSTRFQNKPIKISYHKGTPLAASGYKITRIYLNNNDISDGFCIENDKAVCSEELFRKFDTQKVNELKIILEGRS